MDYNKVTWKEEKTRVVWEIDFHAWHIEKCDMYVGKAQENLLYKMFYTFMHLPNIK